MAHTALPAMSALQDLRAVLLWRRCQRVRRQSRRNRVVVVRTAPRVALQRRVPRLVAQRLDGRHHGWPFNGRRRVVPRRETTRHRRPALRRRWAGTALRLRFVRKRLGAQYISWRTQASGRGTHRRLDTDVRRVASAALRAAVVHRRPWRLHPRTGIARARRRPILTAYRRRSVASR